MDVEFAASLIGDDLYFVTRGVNVVPTLGSELLANPSFTAWTADSPDGWDVYGESAPDPEITERAANQGHAAGPGTGAANLYSSAAAGSPLLYQSPHTAGNWYKVVLNILHVAGTLMVDDQAGGHSLTINSTGNVQFTLRAGTGYLRLFPQTVPSDNTVADVSDKLISNTTQLFTRPKAYGDFSLAFTASAGYQAGVIFNYSDASNFMRLYFDRLDGTVHLIQCIAGTETEIGSWSATYAAGTKLTARVHLDMTMDVLYGAATLVSGLTATGLAGQQAGPFLTDSAGVTNVVYDWDARWAT